MDNYREWLRNEFAAQGHTLTGKLEAEMNIEDVSSNDPHFQMFMLDYGFIVNEGVPPENIVINETVLNGLTQWAMLRFGVGEKEARIIAGRVAGAHKKFGMPTPGSFNFTTTGNRTMFIEDTQAKRLDTVINETTEELQWNVLDLFNEFPSQTI